MHFTSPAAALVRGFARFDMAKSRVAAALFSILALSSPVHAMNIQQVKSPGGIEAWLVEEHGVPLLSMRYAFEGGNSQDPVG